MQNRNKSLDAIKTVAILGVLLIHITAVGFSGYSVGSADWFTSVGWGAVLRPAVPLFFMVSGALFLPAEKCVTTRKIYFKYIFRILLALFAWAVMYELLDVIRGEETCKSAIKNLLFFSHHFHLYYLHIIILVYAFLPITRTFIASAGKRLIEYALMLWIILGIVYPFLRGFFPFSNLSGIPAQYAINLTYSGIGYGILGHYLKTYPPKFNPLFLYLSGLAITFAATAAASISNGTPVAAFLEAAQPGVFLMAIGIYLFFIKREWKSPIWSKISGASFCIYLIHDFFNIAFAHLGFTVKLFPPIISAPVIAAANLALSITVYLFLSKIPLVNKYLI